MRLLLCYICPPLAILLCGKPFSALASVLLWLWPWASAKTYALFVVNNHFQDMRFNRLTPVAEKPVPKTQTRRQLPAREVSARQEQPLLLDDPTVGAHGTHFRRR